MRNRHIDGDESQCCASEMEYRHHFKEFHRLHRSFRFLRPLFLVINVLIVYLLFRWAGLKAIGITIAGLIVFKEIVQLFFLATCGEKGINSHR